MFVKREGNPNAKHWGLFIYISRADTERQALRACDSGSLMMNIGACRRMCQEQFLYFDLPNTVQLAGRMKAIKNEPIQPGRLGRVNNPKCP